MNTCPNCKATLPKGAHFCHTCGATLDESFPCMSHQGLPATPASPSRPSYSNGLVPFVPSSTDFAPTGRNGGSAPLSGKNTRVVPFVKRDWMQKLLTKCIIATISTLAIAVLILVFYIWPGCFVSGTLLLFALATTAACVVLNLPEISIDFVNQLGEARASSLFNQIVNVTLIWEAFWLAVGLVCMFFSWWVVLIAEGANVFILVMIIAGILDSL